jgi:hypothetical protein
MVILRYFILNFLHLNYILFSMNCYNLMFSCNEKCLGDNQWVVKFVFVFFFFFFFFIFFSIHGDFTLFYLKFKILCFSIISSFL